MHGRVGLWRLARLVVLGSGGGTAGGLRCPVGHRRTAERRSGGSARDLHDDAAAVREAADAADGPVVAVAHSYGGAPVTEGLVGAGNVAHLVYVTAFLLDDGESLLGAVGGVEPPWWRTSADGLTLEPDDPEHVFFADCPPDVATAAVAALRPQARRHSPFLSQPDERVKILRQVLEVA